MRDNTIYIDPSVTRYLEKAAYIAFALSDTIIHSAYFVMAAFHEDEIFTSYFNNLTGSYFSLSDFIYQLATVREDYESIFSKAEEKNKNEEGNDDKKDDNVDVNSNKTSDKDDSSYTELAKDFTIAELKEFIAKAEEEFMPQFENVSIEEFEKKFKIKFFRADYSKLEFAPIYSVDLGTALTDALNRCRQAGRNTLDFANLIYSVINVDGSSAQKFIEYMGIDPYDITETIEYYYNIYPEYDENLTSFILPPEVEEFCEILNDKYSEDVVCDILGRDSEINTFWITASRKTKKNAILTGPAGSGKTAIVEAITMSIVNKTAPKEFLDYTVISLNLTSMIAGTMYRGEFEQKAQDLIDFLTNKPKVILFIDEIHQVMGAGSTSSNEGFSLAGILKPILARDDAIVIGATTTNEYERFISKDAAFKRRFERIQVNEPKISELKPMIKKKVESLSKYHKVSISEDVLDYIIIQAYCFNPETANPDKTISLCDSAMAVAKTKNKKALAKIHVNEVNAISIKRYKELPEDYKLSTAYHEAGHYVMARILPKLKSKSTVVLSIIPTDEYEGVHSFEINEKDVCSHDAQYFKENMISLMAGRVSEEYFSHSINSGARTDLARINNLVRNMILVNGMDPDGTYFNLSIMGEEENDATFVTEKTKDYVITATKKYCDEIYKETKKLVEENKAVISRIAKALMHRGMLDSTQLDKLFKGKSMIEIENFEKENITKKSTAKKASKKKS